MATLLRRAREAGLPVLEIVAPRTILWLVPAESPILASVHGAAAGLHRIGLVDKSTMREFDALCLTPVEPMGPEEIRALREREKVSQPVFAHYLNVRKDAVSKWERGEKRPDGPSLKLLNLVKAKGLQAIA